MAPLTSLPVELKQIIYFHLSDALSISALSQTCIAFHLALPGIEQRLLSKIVQDSVPTALLSIAIDVADAARLTKPWNRNGVRRILDRLFEYKTSTDWTLSRAIFIARLHEDISFFTVDFATTALDNLKNGLPADLMLAPLCSSETHRIMRTLYIFELYRCLFRHHKFITPGHARFSALEQRLLFFERFPPWQLEQLACIHDYLLRYISPAVEDVARHDIVWGKQRIGYLAANSKHKQHFLSMGLTYIRKAGAAISYDERHTLLHSAAISKQVAGSDPKFLHASMTSCTNKTILTTASAVDKYTHFGHFSIDQVRISTLEKGGMKPNVQNHLTGDNDYGPLLAWWRFHRERSWCTPVCYSNESAKLRRMGYVMWDCEKAEVSDAVSLSYWGEPIVMNAKRIERCKSHFVSD
ncbi:MAG: hypothetical protein MMC33_006704 [Icmadophila ericetorum]|nr:hypothetical protein [Icmadophila ericetorum]